MRLRVFIFIVLVILQFTLLHIKEAQTQLPRNFIAFLNGKNEIPKRVTFVTGQAILGLDYANNEITYELMVAKINNVVAAHIHLGFPGENGPIIVFLAGPFDPGKSGLVDGVLAKGTITKANLTGPFKGKDLSILITAMYNGSTYINVHTNDGLAPANTGPGNFPGGEIRGQIKEKGLDSSDSSLSESEGDHNSDKYIYKTFQNGNEN